MANAKKNSAAFIMPAKSSNSRVLAGAHFKKGGTIGKAVAKPKMAMKKMGKK